MRLPHVLTVLACVLALNGATATLASADPHGDGGSGKIRPQLAATLDKQESGVDFWVYFGAKPDLSAAAKIKDWTARGTAVADALKKNAEQSQRAARADLAASGVEYQSFWATNAIKVTDGSATLADKLAAKTEVTSLMPSFAVHPPPVTKGVTQRNAATAAEWGIANIHADQVWDQLGVHGEDITVASIDTGAQYDHPALVRQYRGNKGDGTFDHNYNWFDAAGACDGAPCDIEGHGTHTMGTMVGDDGAGNEIGVAPGATWIAANGCCPSDAALIASGQWMLEPSDLRGENPDASKRPNIINNSWGSTAPSDEPMLEDISLAWNASGIFGVWANGNAGPGCKTSGTPGSRIINYSVGAYDADNGVADFSSRGAGQGGETKPNIAAPGVNVRSAWPGSGYLSLNGTSMATPHVAGAIALVWSAAPVLRGDIEATRQLLDGTAVDAPDGECGGTADDNNVFGEGRLDALTLLAQSPRGVTGRLGGTVADTVTGEPIAGAVVALHGPVDRELTTGADGAYRSGALPVGDYAIEASKYGYSAGKATATVTDGATATVNLTVAAQEMRTVGGTVTDGSGHDWPIYAKVTVDGYPLGPVFTDPLTGRYQVRLPAAATYTLHVFAQYDGYQVANRSVAVGAADVTENVALTADLTSCTAPGYRWQASTEGFDGLPEGWTTTGTSSWRFDNPAFRPPPPGGQGGFAIADATLAHGRPVHATLVSPVIDLSTDKAPRLTFDTSYYSPGAGQTAEVGLSVDGGRTWRTVWRQTTKNAIGQVALALPQAASKSKVKVRFRYAGRRSWWWTVDNVSLGTHTCASAPGGLIVGRVTDRDTAAPIFATVTRTDAPKQSGTGVTTPVDPNVGDGLYWVFSSATGPTGFTASATGYATATETIPVAANALVAHDWALTPDPRSNP